MQPKTVLITGCSSGIGRATARLFLQEGWRVYATAREEADIAALDDHEESRLLELDVTDDRQCKRAVNRVLQESGRIDCLVNNAGYGQFGPVEDVTTEAVHAQFDVNVYGPHRLTRRVLPHMREQGNGTVVNLSSVAGRVSFPGGGVYCGSKFALEAMTDALRAEVEEYGVDAVLVEPGPVDTEFVERAEAEVTGDEGVTDGGDDTGIERSGAYESFYELFEDTQAIGGGGPGAVSPERVATVVVEAASSPDPDPRYPVGTLARLATYARFVPDRLRDKLLGLARSYLA